ncbi:MAG: SCO family protein [Phycisphaerales bacterium]
MKRLSLNILRARITSALAPAIGGRAIAATLLAGSVAASLLPATDAAAQMPRAERGEIATLDPVEELDTPVIDRLGNQIPTDIAFLDHTGKPVTLADYFDGERPVILTLNYFRCPMLCIATINGLTAGLNDVDWQAGRDFTMLTVSFNPEEGPELAAAKRENYLTTYKKPNVAGGWHFLTGEKAEIDRLCEAVGFTYRYDEKSGEYAHPASVIFASPDGIVTLHMNDVLFQPQDLRLAIVEASQGSVGTWVDSLLLFTCFQYDPDAGGYTASAMKLLRAAAIVTIVVILAAIFIMSRRGRSSGGGSGPSPEIPAGRPGDEVLT